ncbi:alpha/beta fold hydrolase [Kerstersia gyiorum]|jgi:pimeloyl-ACP methyl ester carboxylesterase|uniref:alpha/beta fold hydrolase n=1 Tax=Kerstersia gyiorum TaxID=206506 RepID=UPI00242A5E9F|nr:alpha/beta hydrolase [Kerstersia gyiorum]MCH4272574.1 alpha/beta hydrolase [Kerstersia gyiorum]MCI1229859.1 alpha/beta hydrolase [Kerstersia gyiorum]
MAFASFPMSADFTHFNLPDTLSWAGLRAGHGAPLLFIHGSLCDARYWRAQVTEFAQHGRDAIAPSLRAYFPDKVLPALSWEQDVEDLMQLVGALPGKVDVVAHSRGGLLAAHLALRMPEKLGKLVLVEPAGRLEGEDSEALRLDKAFRDELAGQLSAGITEAAVAEFVDSVSRAGSWRYSPASFRRMALDNAHTLPSQLTTDLLPHYQPADLAALSLPILLIQGQRSPERFHQTVAALAAHLPNARVVQVDGASHAVNLAHPRRFNDIVRAFLDGTA